MSWEDYKKQREQKKKKGIEEDISIKAGPVQNPSQVQEKNYKSVATWDTVKRGNNNVRLLSKDETKNSVEITRHDIDAMSEAEKFNKIMETGTTAEKVNALLGHFGESIIGGAKQTVGGVANIGTTFGAGIVKGARLIASDEGKEKLDKWYDDILKTGREINDKATYFNKVNSRINNNAIRIGTGVTNTVANIATNAVATLGTGGGAVLQGLQVGGSSSQEVLNENKEKIGQAIGTGALKGLTSYLTEKMFDANILTKGSSKSSIQQAINRTMENRIKSQVGRKIADKFIGIAGENIEELVEDNVGNVIDKVINNKDLPGFKEWLNNTSETVKATTLSTILLNSIGLGGNNYNDIENELKRQNASDEDIKNADYWINKAQQIINESENDKVINQETKMPQNQISQTENDIKTQTKNNLAKVRQFYDENTFNQMQQFIETAPSEKALNQINEDIKTETKNRLEQVYKSGRFTESQERKRTFAKYQREKNTNGIQYNSDVVNKALDTVSANRNGRRTVGQWKQVAEQIGLEASNLPKTEIDDIAYGSWFDLEPTKNITKYDNRTKEHKGFEKFTSDDWINTIYESAKGQKLQKLDTVLNSELSTSQNIEMKQTQENTKGQAVNWNEIERPEENRKFRKHYKSIIESDNTTAEAKVIAKELMGTDTYVPETNKGELMQADERIATSSPEVELKSLISKSINNEKISPVDIATGERLIQYFSKTGSKEQLQEAIQATALAGTRAGQTVQALAILNHQTPQGQATWMQRSVDKMNKELAKKKGGTITKDDNGNIKVVNKQGKDITNKVDLFNLTPEMLDKIMNSENEEQMHKNIDEVYEELGQQVPKSMIEKIDTWRYFSMLANIRTHARNMIGNVAMGKMQRVKDKLAGGIEDVVSKFNPEMERTKTLKFADKRVKEFAKKDFKNIDVQSRLELNESKFNPQSRLQNARKTFKSDVMENTLGKLFDLNDTLLEAEDGLGLKAGYQKALADYLTANKIDVDNISDAQLGKARNYAIQQAKEATFHQANALANLVNQLGTKNKVGKFIVDATLPFKKTPMNVAKSGIEYSPVGLLKSAIFDTANLRKGNISINQYIDNVSKGLTGSGVTLVGYALAKAGILKASGSDDKDKEKYDEEQGRQSYSIEIAGKTYSLDWLAPTGIPLFIGAEINNLENQQGNEKNSEKKTTEDWKDIVGRSIANITNAGATAINPMSEMSMISGITSVLSSYNKDNALGDMATNMGKSYINQFVPTVLGQVAKTTDDYERTTKTTKTGTFEKALDQTVNQIKNKIPGLRQTLPIKTDIWGKELKQEVNLPLRAVNNFINPATVKEVSTDKVDMELNKLYEEKRNSDLLPDILQKKLKLNGTDYRWTNKEYAEYTKKYGQTSYNLINDFIKTSDYKNLTQEQKENVISNIYSYAKEKNKLEYAKKVDEEVKPSTLYTTMETIKKDGGKQIEYLNYASKTKGMSKESEKNKVLANSNYSNKTKEIIYTNGTGKDDNLYNNLLSKSNINMTEYLNYKSKITQNTNKEETLNYLNKYITKQEDRLLIASKKYSLQNSEKQKLAEYINQIASTKEERIEIYKQLDKNFTIKNGKVYMKVSKK